MNSPRQGVSDLPEICFRHGMRTVVISPGSRNAPLIFSFTGHPKLECLSVTDERSAAYFALGLAVQTRQPVGLICTSGTAALNFAPAIAEAYYQNIPLIVLTADRPGEWIDQADGQTIRQDEIYRNYIRQSYLLPVETVTDSDLWHFNRLVNEAMNMSLGEPSGPVHLNVQLREPLYNPMPPRSIEPRIIRTINTPSPLPPELLTQLQSLWNSSQKKMVIAGAGVLNEQRSETINLLAENPSVVIMAENLSNIFNEQIISSPERFFASLTEEEAGDFRPDLLITIGQSVVSARLKKYLRHHAPGQHWHISTSSAVTDTFQGLTHSIVASPEKLLAALTKNGKKPGSTYRDTVLNKELRVREKHEKLTGEAPYSDLTVYDTILNRLPANCHLHLANSTPIRYSQLFAGRKDIQYHCNRGTSGIDGCLSTAAGCSVASPKPVVLITGDLSFIYDSNSLWIKYLKGNFKIIVINNGGGNIFRLIETGQSENPARDFFETPHHVNISLLTEAFGARHALCQSKEELPAMLDWFFEPADVPYVLEIITGIGINTDVFKDYYKQIKIV